MQTYIALFDDANISQGRLSGIFDKMSKKCCFFMYKIKNTTLAG